MRVPILMLFLTVLLLLGGPALAHHSFAAFDMKQEVRISGTVSEVQYTNPHVWVFVDVTSPDGATETWAIEAGGPNILIRSGWMANTVQAGQRVEVVLHPMRDSSKKGGSLVSIKLPDGKVIQ